MKLLHPSTRNRLRNVCQTGTGAMLALIGSALPLMAEPPMPFTLELRPATAGKPSPDTGKESVFSRTKDLDDQGLNRTLRGISEPTLTVYRAETPAHGGAAVVVCPGGGYGSVVIDREGLAIARWMQSHGVTAAVLKYRLPDQSTFATGMPASQQDALDALRVMRHQAAKLGISKNRLGIIGFSAGGHLAGSTAVFGKAADDSRPDFVALLYPVVLMEGEFAHQGSRKNLIGPEPPPARIGEFSLERRATAGMPPFFLFHSENDHAVPVENSSLLAKALREKHVPVEFNTCTTGRHGFALGRDADSSRWPGLFLKWLDSPALAP